MPLPRRLTIPILVLALAGLSACAPADSEPSPAPTDIDAGDTAAVAEAAPDTAESSAPASPVPEVSIPDELQFTTQTVSDGAPFDASTLAGRDTILWFWAPWCPTCQAESGDLAAAAEELPDGVTLMGVAGQSELPDMQSFLTEFGVDNFAHMTDVDGSIWERFGVTYQPAYALINDDGTVQTLSGPMGKDGVLEAAAALADS